MLFWIAVIIMSSVVVAAIVWPLLRARQDAREEVDFDIEVFRDQLAEVVREHGEGRLEYAEAEAAKAEISRRILAADAARRQRSDQQGIVRDAECRQPTRLLRLSRAKRQTDRRLPRRGFVRPLPGARARRVEGNGRPKVFLAWFCADALVGVQIERARR